MSLNPICCICSRTFLLYNEIIAEAASSFISYQISIQNLGPPDNPGNWLLLCCGISFSLAFYQKSFLPDGHCYAEKTGCVDLAKPLSFQGPKFCYCQNGESVLVYLTELYSDKVEHCMALFLETLPSNTNSKMIWETSLPF